MKKKYVFPQITAVQIAPMRLMDGSVGTKIDDTPAEEPSFSRSYFGPAPWEESEEQR